MVFSWHFRVEQLLLVLPAVPAMRYNTALSLCALGIGLCAIAANEARIAGVLGLAIAVLGGATLWQQFAGIDLGIDQRLMVDYLAQQGNASNPEHPGRMAASTAICLACMGTALLFIALQKWGNVSALLATVSAVLALVSLLSIAFRVGTEGQDWLSTGSGVQTAILLTAGAFAILYSLVSAGDREFGRFVAVGAGLGAFTLVLIAWQGLRDSESKASHAKLAAQGEAALEAVEGVAAANVQALHRMASRWRGKQGRSRLEWEQEARDYLSDLPGIESIGFIDTTSAATTILPKEDPAKLRTIGRAKYQYLASLEQREARNGDEDSTSELGGIGVDAEHRFLSVTALGEGQFIAASFDPGILVRRVLRRESRQGMQVELALPFRSDVDPHADDAARVVRLPIRLAGQRWEFRIAAASEQTTDQWSGGRAGLVLWGGALFSLTLVVAIDRALYARLRARQSERQRAALAESEEKYRVLVDTMGEGVTIVQGERVAFANPAISRMMGYSPEEMIGLHFSQTLTPKDAAMVAKRHRERINAASGEEPLQRYEVQLVRKDGSVFWAELDARRSEFQGHVAVTALFRDVDERKRSELLLKAERQRIDLVLKGSVDGIWDWNARDDEYTFSDRCFELLGYVRGSVGRDREGWRALVHPDDRTRLLSRLTRHFMNHETFDLECRLLASTGAYRWYRIAGQADWDESGVVTRMAGSLSEIEERKAAEVALALSEARFRGAMENAAIGMALVSLDGRWLEVNAAICEIVGYSPAELKALTFQDITFSDDLDTDLAYVNDVLDGRRASYRMEKRYIRKDGELVWVLLAVSLARDAEGAPDYFISQIEDIDQRKRQEELLRKALDEKELLLREVYHRVKNNLQVVHSLLSIQGRALGEGAGRAAILETASRVRAMALVHERLYRSGTVESMPVRGFVEELIANVKESSGADPGRVQIESDIEDLNVGLDVGIALGLLVNELVTNAVKHAFPTGVGGKVVVSLNRLGEIVELQVKDNGVGVQSGKETERAESMGLRLAAALSRQLGGVLESRSDVGALFSVRFKPQ